MIRISIIIPIYNVEKYIEKCIASVASQTYKDYEIIAVNDCTTDTSIEILQNCIEKYNISKDRIKIINHDRNRGLSAARNTGIKHSKAEFVYFLDRDDSITPDCIEKLIKASRWCFIPADIVVGNYRFDGPELGCPHIRVKWPMLSRRGYIKAHCKERIFPMAWNRLVRRDFLLKHNLFFEEGLIHEDTLWNFQILQYIGCVGSVKDETYIYRIREGSIQTTEDAEKHLRANRYIVGKMAEIMSASSLKRNKYVRRFVNNETQRFYQEQQN